MTTLMSRIGNLARSASFARLGNMVINSVERRFRVASPRSYPLSLDIVLTRACNLQCEFCITSTVEGERWLPYDLYERIAAELFPRAREVLFCSGGEPLLYPKLRDALRLADRHGLLTVMVSNGMLLDKEKRDWIIADQCLRQYFVSFDGATKESLERIRRGAKFEIIVENVAQLSQEKSRAGMKFPEIGLRYSVMKQNAEELPAVCGLCKKMGVTQLEVSYVTVTGDMKPEDSLFYHQDLAEQVFEETAAKAREHGIRAHLPPLPRDDAAPRRCEEPWRFAQVDTDGSIHFCYRAWIQPVGNFRDGFRNAWRNDDYCALRKTMDADVPHFPYCEFCSARNGLNNPAAHHQKLHEDAYRFRNGDAPSQFNSRREENRLAFRSTLPITNQSREDGGESDADGIPRLENTTRD